MKTEYETLTLIVFFFFFLERRILMRKEFEKLIYRSLFKEYPEIVTVREVSLMLNLSTRTVYQLVKDGKIQHIPCGRKIRIARIAVIEYVLQSAQ